MCDDVAVHASQLCGITDQVPRNIGVQKQIFKIVCLNNAILNCLPRTHVFSNVCQASYSSTKDMQQRMYMPQFKCLNPFFKFGARNCSFNVGHGRGVGAGEHASVRL